MEATRESFGKQLVISGKDYPEIIAVNADLGKATKLSLFKDAYPDRFIEVGIAENNMIGISSGLSEHGYKVFLASFATFLTGKYDTIRCSISYSQANVILVGSHGGMAIGKDGVTQMGLEDISLMRSLPGMVVLNPATPIEAREITKYLCETELKHPHYLRIGRQPVKEYFSENYNFDINQAIRVREGRNIKDAIFSSGCILEEAMKAAEELDLSVWNFPVLDPIDEETIKKLGYVYENIYTIEDHSIIGGLGSAVAEVLAKMRIHSRLIKIGVEGFPEAGPPTDLYDKYGLSAKKIKMRIKSSTKSF